MHAYQIHDLTRPIPKIDLEIVAASHNYYFAPLKLNDLTVPFCILIELFQTAGQYGRI